MDLRTGGLVIGWVGVIGVIVSVIFKLALYAFLNSEKNKHIMYEQGIDMEECNN